MRDLGWAAFLAICSRRSASCSLGFRKALTAAVLGLENAPESCPSPVSGPPLGFVAEQGSPPRNIMRMLNRKHAQGLNSIVGSQQSTIVLGHIEDTEGTNHRGQHRSQSKGASQITVGRVHAAKIGTGGLPCFVAPNLPNFDSF